MKLLTSLTFLGITWLANSMIELREKVIKFETNMEAVKTFTSKPRFTAEDFSQQITPIYNQVKEQERKLEKRELWMSQIDNRLNESQLVIQRLESDIETLKGE